MALYDDLPVGVKAQIVKRLYFAKTSGLSQVPDGAEEGMYQTEDLLDGAVVLAYCHPGTETEAGRVAMPIDSSNPILEQCPLPLVSLDPSCYRSNLSSMLVMNKQSRQLAKEFLQEQKDQSLCYEASIFLSHQTHFWLTWTSIPRHDPDRITNIVRVIFVNDPSGPPATSIWQPKDPYPAPAILTFLTLLKHVCQHGAAVPRSITIEEAKFRASARTKMSIEEGKPRIHVLELVFTCSEVEYELSLASRCLRFDQLHRDSKLPFVRENRRCNQCDTCRLWSEATGGLPDHHPIKLCDYLYSYLTLVFLDHSGQSDRIRDMVESIGCIRFSMNGKQLYEFDLGMALKTPSIPFNEIQRKYDLRHRIFMAWKRQERRDRGLQDYLNIDNLERSLGFCNATMSTTTGMRIPENSGRGNMIQSDAELVDLAKWGIGPSHFENWPRNQMDDNFWHMNNDQERQNERSTRVYPQGHTVTREAGVFSGSHHVLD